MKVFYTIHTPWQPSGAAYNRVKMLCEGLKYNNVDCKLVAFRTPQFSNGLLSKAWTILLLLRYAIIFARLKKDDIFVIYGELTLLKYILKLPRKAKLIIERNEYSTYLIREELPADVVSKIKNFEILLSECDGMIVCSDYLKNYYRQFTNAPITVVPLVVDCDKFNIATCEVKKNILYCGDFGGNKDGLPILLDAFSKISKTYPDFKLILVGDTSEDNSMEILKQKVNELNIEDNIIFTGRVEHSKMPKLLADAALLVLARPANKQAEGGIPSKLAEYLATGRPTLVTRVGELDKYLTDNKDIVFAKPDSVDDFADKMNDILSNYEYYAGIGKQGAKSVKQFDYKLWSNKLKRFFTNDVQR